MATVKGNANVDMAGRLKPYGVTAAQALGEPIIVPPDKVLSLGLSDLKQAKAGIVQLKPKTISDVKQWIGVKDEVGRKRPVAAMPQITSLTLSDDRTLALRNQADSRGVHQLAEMYVLGDSAAVKHLEPAINKLLIDASILGIFSIHDIDVYGTLNIDPSVRVLVARNIRIWGKGVIRVRGQVKIDAVSITGAARGFTISPDVLKAIPRIGRLT